jgi:hypothetical protein
MQWKLELAHIKVTYVKMANDDAFSQGVTRLVQLYQAAHPEPLTPRIMVYMRRLMTIIQYRIQQRGGNASAATVTPQDVQEAIIIELDERLNDPEQLDADQ